MVIGKADLLNFKGPTVMAFTLHVVAVLLKQAKDWDWFVNLSAADYPLISQDEPEKRGNASSSLSSEFFTAYPLLCDPSNLRKYPPAKEQDYLRMLAVAYEKTQELAKDLHKVGCGDLDVEGLTESLLSTHKDEYPEHEGASLINYIKLSWENCVLRASLIYLAPGVLDDPWELQLLLTSRYLSPLSLNLYGGTRKQYL
ncbi:hypothetical protein V2J09_004131 [Rumex salicifolius]